MFDIQETTNNCSFTTKLKDINVIGIGSDITLSCFLDKECDVKWYKAECDISLNDRFKFKDERFKHQLIIADIEEADSGVYSCQCGRTKTSCKLKVKVNPLIKQLENVTITADQKLILTCKLNAKCENVKWHKTNGTIPDWATITNYRIGGSGAHMYKLELNPVKMEDAGEYRCHIENVITTCNVTVNRIQEIQIDDSVPRTTLLHALNSTKDQLRVTEDELLHTKTELEKANSEIRQKEISKRETETETAQIRALLKKTESELENKENCIKELKVENKQLAVFVEKLDSISEVLESNRKQSAQMEEHIEKLEGEKQHLEERVSSLESFINDGKSNDQQHNFLKQQQQVLAEFKTVIEDMKKNKDENVRLTDEKARLEKDMKKNKDENVRMTDEKARLEKEEEKKKKKSKVCSVS